MVVSVVRIWVCVVVVHVEQMRWYRMGTSFDQHLATTLSSSLSFLCQNNVAQGCMDDQIRYTGRRQREVGK
jgi:hypothetical protein